MKVVITGPTGTIGTALMQECVKNKIQVLAICHRDSKRKNQIPKSPFIKVKELNMNEYNQTAIAENSYDIFYHLAWEGTIGTNRNNIELQYKNIGYSLDAVHLAKRLGCHTFIGAGSQAEYGRSKSKLSATTPVFPETEYGMAKLCAGQMTRVLCRQLNIKHIWTRVLSVYGPYDSDRTMIMSAIQKLLNNETPEFTKGEQQWDYLYSSDAGKALFLLGQTGKNEKIYPIGSGETKQLAEFIYELRDAVKPGAEITLGTIPYSKNQVMYLCADISELTSDTGFYPKTSFYEGIQKTAAWIKRNK